MLRRPCGYASVHAAATTQNAEGPSMEHSEVDADAFIANGIDKEEEDINKLRNYLHKLGICAAQLETVNHCLILQLAEMRSTINTLSDVVLNKPATEQQLSHLQLVALRMSRDAQEAHKHTLLQLQANNMYRAMLTFVENGPR